MATTIEVSNLSTPYLVNEIVAQTQDLSATEVYRSTIIVTTDQLRALRIGGIPTAGGGALISSVGSPKRVSGNLWEVEVQSIAQPRDYSYRDLQSATFYPNMFGNLKPAEAKRLRSSMQPVSILCNCDVSVRFVSPSALSSVRVVIDPQPTFRGTPVNFYGVVYNDEGISIGFTSPNSAPKRQIIGQSMEPFQAGLYTVTTTTAIRPNNL